MVTHENLRHATTACAACLADLIDVMMEGDPRSESEDYGEYCSRMRLTFSFGAVEDSDEEDEDLIRWWWAVAEVVFDAYERLAELGQQELFDLLRDGLIEPETGVDVAWLTRSQMADACWYLDELVVMMNKR